jgi:hypothetical protein
MAYGVEVAKNSVRGIIKQAMNSRHITNKGEMAMAKKKKADGNLELSDLGIIIDEMCYCGAKKSEHDGFQGHGPCKKTKCEKFTWKGFITKK